VTAALTPLVAISVWSAVAASGNYRGFVFRGLPDLESDSSSGSGPGPTGDLSLVAGPAGACVLTTDSRMGLIFAVLISVVAAVFTAALALPAASDYGLPNAMWGCLVTMGGTALACAVVVGLSANNDVGTVAAADTLYILVSAGAVVWFACAQAWTAVVPLLQGATVTEAAIATRALLAACGVPLGPSDHWVSHCMAHVGPRCLEVTTVNGKPKGGPVLVPLPREGRAWGSGSSTRWPTRPPAHASVFEVGSPSDEEDEQLPAARAGAGAGAGTGTGTRVPMATFVDPERRPGTEKTGEQAGLLQADGASEQALDPDARITPDVDVVVDLAGIQDKPGRAQVPVPAPAPVPVPVSPARARARARAPVSAPASAPASASALEQRLSRVLDTMPGMALALGVPQVASLFRFLWRDQPQILACMEFMAAAAAWRHQLPHGFEVLERAMSQRLDLGAVSAGMHGLATDMERAREVVAAANVIRSKWLLPGLSSGLGAVAAPEGPCAPRCGAGSDRARARAGVFHESEVRPLVPPPVHTETSLRRALRDNAVPVHERYTNAVAKLRTVKSYVLGEALHSETAQLVFQAMVAAGTRRLLDANSMFGRSIKPRGRALVAAASASAAAAVAAAAAAARYKDPARQPQDSTSGSDSEVELGSIPLNPPGAAVPSWDTVTSEPAATLATAMHAPWNPLLFDDLLAVTATFVFLGAWKSTLATPAVKHRLLRLLMEVMQVAAPHMCPRPPGCCGAHLWPTQL
jgi:hypothetical protein